MQIVESFQALKNVLPLSWSNVSKKRHFFSYRYNKSKSTKLYSISKKPLPIIFSSTCFKKHQDFLFEQPSREEKPTLFFYLPSTTNSSHVINQVRENVSLHPIDCPYIDCLMKLSNNIQKPEKSLCPHT